ncbi:acyl-CoA dehydrogenase family protein [Actinokineospora sp. 24-640]
MPEPGLTPAEVIARAEAIALTLVERQGETEALRQYPEDVHQTFSDAGFYRLLTPARYGGYEFGVRTFGQVAMALARGCPSTAWMYVFGHAHALAAATLFEKPTQDALFADGEFICPTTVGPAGSAVPVDGGWVVNGTWGYCSGSPYATHFMAHALVAPAGEGLPPTPLLFVVPRSAFRRHDDWGSQLGLRGSGSHSITVENVFVPEGHALATHLSQYSVVDGTPGRALHGSEYGGGPLSFMLLELGFLAVGMAKGALDAYAGLMRSRMTAFVPFVPRTEDPDFQFNYGEAAGKIATAETAVLGALAQWSELSAQGAAAFTREEEMRLSTISREVIRLAWSAVESHLVPTAGSSSVKQGERIERVWRDMSMLHSHAGVGGFLATRANRELAKAHFGIAA